MSRQNLLIRNTFVEVDNHNDEDSLPRTVSDQTHTRRVQTQAIRTEPVQTIAEESVSNYETNSLSGTILPDLKDLAFSLQGVLPSGFSGFDSAPVFYPGSTLFGAMAPLVFPPSSLSNMDARETLIDWSYPRVGDYRWHAEAGSMGSLSADGKSFVKQQYEGRLSMVTESTLHSTGIQRYAVYVESGVLSVADGFGYIFSGALPCKKNIQKIDSIFVNKRGRVCCRIHNEVVTMDATVAPIDVGAVVDVLVDLNNKSIRFSVFAPPAELLEGRSHVDANLIVSSPEYLVGTATVSIADIAAKCRHDVTGHFCFVVKNTDVKLTFLSSS